MIRDTNSNTLFANYVECAHKVANKAAYALGWVKDYIAKGDVDARENECDVVYVACIIIEGIEDEAKAAGAGTATLSAIHEEYVRVKGYDTQAMQLCNGADNAIGSLPAGQYTGREEIPQ